MLSRLQAIQQFNTVRHSDGLLMPRFYDIFVTHFSTLFLRDFSYRLCFTSLYFTIIVHFSADMLSFILDITYLKPLDIYAR